MKLLYIAAPYRASSSIQIQHNIAEASIMAQNYWLEGFAVICPHLNSANFDGLVDDHIFLNGTMEMLSKCSHIAMHPDWQNSIGCIEEHKYAEENDLTIYKPKTIEFLRLIIIIKVEKRKI